MSAADDIEVPVTRKAVWPEFLTCVICDRHQPDHFFMGSETGPAICSVCLWQMRPPLWTIAGHSARDRIRLARLNAVISALEWETKNCPHTLRRSPTASA